MVRLERTVAGECVSEYPDMKSTRREGFRWCCSRARAAPPEFGITTSVTRRSNAPPAAKAAQCVHPVLRGRNVVPRSAAGAYV